MDWDRVHHPVEKPADTVSTSEPVATFWQLVGPSGRPITCALFEVATGLELRAGYSDEDVLHTQLFRGPDARQQAEAKAEQWRCAAVEKGFVDNGGIK